MTILNTNLYAPIRIGIGRIRRGTAAVTQWCRGVIGRNERRGHAPVALFDQVMRRGHLDSACKAISMRRFDEAETSLAAATQHAPHDCVAWNLLGVVHECRAEWKLARRCYGKATVADRSFAPAQQNLRRLYELYTFGHSKAPVALGMPLPQSGDPDASFTREAVVPTPF